jgi:nucleoside-diphosphate-sugar epimerase
MTVAVSGAGGFVGRQIVAALRARGHAVVAMSRAPVAGLEHLAFDLRGEVPPAEQLRQHGVTALVHAAWDFSASGLDEARRINVAATARLAQEAAAVGASLIAISTMSAFPGCRSVYGQSKLEMEQLFLQQGGLVLRPGLVWNASPGGMVGTLDRLARLPVAPVISGGGKLYTIHADDLAALIIRAVETPPAAQVLTVAHPRPWSLREILQLRAQVAGRHPLLLPVPWPLAWLGVRLIQSLKPKSGLRADSVTGLVHANPHPIFAPVLGLLKPSDLRAFCAVADEVKSQWILQ